MNISRKLGLAALLLASMIVVVGATPWDGVPDDPTPAQAIWVDPKTTTCLNTGDTFVVDILVNVTDPDGAGPLIGLFGFQYKFYWNSSVLQAVEIQTHCDNIPSGDRLPGWTMVFVAQNETAPGSHSYSVSAIGGVAFTGVDSLCTYTFQVLGSGSCALDISGDILADDAADPIDHTAVDGTYCPVAVQHLLTIEVEGSGNTDPSPGSYMYDEGTVVSVDAIPDPGWRLDHWLLDAVDDGADDPHDVTMDSDHTLTAVFVEMQPGELPGDINGDNIVNIFDAIPIGVAFGSRPGDPKWNPIADIAPAGEPDNFINIQDVVLWATHFGETL